MSQRVSIDGLADAVNQAMEEFRERTEDVVSEAVTKVSKEAKQIAKSGSPTKTGGYAKGWATKKTKDAKGQTEITVYNRRKPGLTHLLEKGHAKRGGGRTKAYVHIAPAESYAVEALENEIKRGVGG